VKEREEEKHVLGIYTQPGPVGLHKPPEDVFCGFVDVVAASVFGEVPFEGNLTGWLVVGYKGGNRNSLSAVYS
jgi:hypothetical protein